MPHKQLLVNKEKGVSERIYEFAKNKNGKELVNLLKLISSDQEFAKDAIYDAIFFMSRDDMETPKFLAAQISPHFIYPSLLKDLKLDSIISSPALVMLFCISNNLYSSVSEFLGCTNKLLKLKEDLGETTAKIVIQQITKISAVICDKGYLDNTFKYGQKLFSDIDLKGEALYGAAYAGHTVLLDELLKNEPNFLKAIRGAAIGGNEKLLFDLIERAQKTVLLNTLLKEAVAGVFLGGHLNLLPELINNGASLESIKKKAAWLKNTELCNKLTEFELSLKDVGTKNYSSSRLFYMDDNNGVVQNQQKYITPSFSFT